MPPLTDSERLIRWARLLQLKETELQQEIRYQQDFEQATVPFLGQGNTHNRILVRGPGPPYKRPLGPLPPTEAGYSVHWDKKRGFYYWIHREQLKAEFNPPPKALLQITFTREDYKALGEPGPKSDKEPPESEKEEEEEEEEEELPLL